MAYLPLAIIGFGVFLVNRLAKKEGFLKYKRIYTFIYLVLLVFSSIAQEGPGVGENMMISPRAPEPMVYIRDNEKLYIGLDGRGNKTVYDMRCFKGKDIPVLKYYSQNYLESKGCVRYSYGEPE